MVDDELVRVVSVDWMEQMLAVSAVSSSAVNVHERSD